MNLEKAGSSLPLRVRLGSRSLVPAAFGFVRRACSGSTGPERAARASFGPSLLSISASQSCVTGCLPPARPPVAESQAEPRQCAESPSPASSIPLLDLLTQRDLGTFTQPDTKILRVLFFHG